MFTPKSVADTNKTMYSIIHAGLHTYQRDQVAVAAYVWTFTHSQYVNV